MGQSRYDKEVIELALKEFDETRDVHAVSEKFGIPTWVIYRYRRKREQKPQDDMRKQIRSLERELESAREQVEILKFVLKKTCQITIPEDF